MKQQILALVAIIRALPLVAIVLSLFLGAITHAASVTIAASPLGGDLFQYALVINSAGSDPPISGLNVLNAGTVFALTPTSTIIPPLGWDFFPPGPGVDELNYFSLTPLLDVPPGGLLGGFAFQSMRNPSTLGPNDFRYDLINGLTGSQIPEPTTMLLLATGLAGIGKRCARGVKPRREGKALLFTPSEG
jgi:hypothetical protein